jgi:hypothetical protein
MKQKAQKSSVRFTVAGAAQVKSFGAGRLEACLAFTFSCFPLNCGM